MPYVTETLKDAKGVFVAASDYVRALPESISKWIPGPLFTLGTDGFGRSDGRRHLRDFFEVDERYVVLAALHMLAREGNLDVSLVKKAMKEMNIDANKANPMLA
jgi:pyruvate dehydrogenase E1 component